MNAAIRKYLLQDGNGEENSSSSGGSSSSSGILSGNGFVLLSYETLISLGDTYIQMLYETLGIQSDYLPEFRDGNLKYVESANGTTF